MRHFKTTIIAILTLASISIFTGCALIGQIGEYAAEARASAYRNRTPNRYYYQPETKPRYTYSPVVKSTPAGTPAKIYKKIDGWRIHGSGQKYVANYDTYVSQDERYSYLIVKNNGVIEPAYQAELSGGRQVIYPLLSPDGKKVAFTDAAAVEGAADRYTGALKIFDMDTKTVSDVWVTVESKPSYPLVYYWRSGTTLLIQAGSKLYSYDAATGTLSTLLEQCVNMDISASGNLVLYSMVNGETGLQDTLLYDLSKGKSSLLFSAAVSATGRLTDHYFYDDGKIAYTAFKDGKSYAAVFDLKTRTEDLYAEGAYDVCVGFTVKRILFMLDVDGKPEVSSYNFTTGKTYEVTELKTSYEDIK